MKVLIVLESSSVGHGVSTKSLGSVRLLDTSGARRRSAVVGRDASPCLRLEHLAFADERLGFRCWPPRVGAVLIEIDQLSLGFHLNLADRRRRSFKSTFGCLQYYLGTATSVPNRP